MASTCPTRAITFGDALNPEHEVNAIRDRHVSRRGYGVLEEFNVKPNIMYLAQIWNRETRDWDRNFQQEYDSLHHKDDKKSSDGEGHTEQHNGEAPADAQSAAPNSLTGAES